MHYRPPRIPRLAAPLLTSLTLGGCADDPGGSDSFSSVSVSGANPTNGAGTTSGTTEFDPTTGAGEAATGNPDPTNSTVPDPTNSTVPDPTNPDPTNNSGYDTMGYNTMGYNTMGYQTMGYNTMGYNTMGYQTMGYNTMGYQTMGYDTMGYYETMGYGSSTGGECIPEDYCQSDEQCCGGYCDPMYGYCYGY